MKQIDAIEIAIILQLEHHSMQRPIFIERNPVFSKESNNSVAGN